MFSLYFRDKINKIQLVSKEGKNTRVLACSEDNTVRIFNRDTAKPLTTVLPIPKTSTSAKITCLAYCRSSNIIYLLLNDHEIWLYYTK